jgi:hypothetical protein
LLGHLTGFTPASAIEIVAVYNKSEEFDLCSSWRQQDYQERLLYSRSGSFDELLQGQRRNER